MAITIPAPPAPTDLDLALGKAGIGAPLTTNHRRLLALHLAGRVHDFGDCLTGTERRMLADIACGPNVTDRFAALVEAYGDWRQVEESVDAFRYRSDVEPMGREEAIDYVMERLNDALADLVVELASVRS